MIVTFFGHSDFIPDRASEEKMMSLLRETVGNTPAQLFLGGYGGFDSFAYSCCKRYKAENPDVRLIFVSPYLTPSYQKRHLEYYQKIFDEIIYPEIEDTPPRFAISRRNKYMAERADIVIVYIKRDYGGAYQAYKHALKKNKRIFNIAKAT